MMSSLASGHVPSQDTARVKQSRTETTQAPSSKLPAILSGSTDVVQFEAAHVHDVYSAIAPHFSATRYKPWPRIQSFLHSLPPYTLVADVGCGNGKYFGCAQQHLSQKRDEAADKLSSAPTLVSSSSDPALSTVVTAAHRYLLGLDYTEELLRQTQRTAVDPNYSPETRVNPLVPPPPPRSIKQQRAQARRAAIREAREQEVLPRTDVVISDALRCPLRGGIFDAVLSIAVVHHHVTHVRRVAALRELLRLARPDGGQVLVYVWAYEQPVEKQRARGMDPTTGDAMVKWELNEKFDPEKKLFHRFYHFFREGELESACAEAAQSLGVGHRVLESWYDHENWCARIERTS